VKTLKFLSVIVATIWLGAVSAGATTYIWVGSSGGVWTTKTNWSPSTGYPGTSSSDVASFTSGTTVSYSSNLTIGSITTGYNSGAVVISFAGTTPTLSMTSFTLGGGGSSVVQLTFTGTGTVNVSSSPTTNVYLASFAIGAGTIFNLASGQTINMANNPASFSNAGTLNLPGATFTYTANSTSSTFTNSGTINATGGTFTNNATTTNSGTITLQSSCTGNFNAYSSSTAITNSGTINVNNTSTLNLRAPVISNGVIAVSSSTLALGSGSGNGTGFITSSNSIISTSPTTASAFNFTANNTGIINSGNATFTGTTLTLSGGPSYITNSGNFTANGCTFSFTATNTSNGITNSGNFSALTGTQINFTTGQQNFISNSGSFILDASSISLSAQLDYINNKSSGTFTANDNSTINISAYYAYLSNSATFNAGTSASQCIINISGQGNTAGSGACSIYNTNIFNLGSTSVINATGTSGSQPNVIYNNGGTFTLMSDANGSATIGTLGSAASCQGIFNVQRFIAGGGASYRNYRLLSCPVNKNQYTSSSSNVIDLSYLGQSVTVPSAFNGAYIAGPGTGFGSTPLHTTPNPIIYLYQESILPGAKYNSSFTSGKNVGITSIGTNSVTTISTALAGTTTSDNSSGVKIPAGNGYILYYIGSNQRTSTSSSINPDNSTITATGYINQGSVPLYMWGLTPATSLTNTTGTGSRSVGITEVGNPYPSTIDLHQVYTDNSSSIGSTFYELDGINQQFDTYNAVTGTSGSTPFRYVASGQGFYTVASANGSTLTFKEDQKTASTTAPVFPSAYLLAVLPNKGMVTDAVTLGRHTDALSTSVTPTAEAPAGLHLKLEEDSVIYDEVGIYFSNAWSDKYDNNDSFDLDGLNPQVYLSSFTSDSVRTSINALSSYTSGKRVKLYVKAVADGSYTLSMEDFTNIDTSLYNVYLVDNLQKDSVNMVTTKSYTFSLVAADTSAFSSRFVLAVELKNLPAYQLANFSGQKVTTGVQLNWKAYNTGNYTGFVLQKLGTGNNYNALYTTQSDSAVNYSYVDQHPVLGSNVYRLQQSDITGKITYSAPVTIGYNSTSPNSVLNVYPNPATTIINVSLTSSSTNASYTADIYNSSGSIVGHQTVNSNTFTHDVSNYKLGVYIIQLKDNTGNLLGISKFVKVN